MKISPVYHFVPRNQKGNVLVPLNALQNIYPDVFSIQKEKYNGREWVMQQQIPHLNCLWNDVTHTTPIHPSIFREALLASGFSWKQKIPFYKIDPVQAKFTTENTVIYLARHTLKASREEQERDLTPFDPELLPHLTDLPEATLQYYREMKAENKRPLLFVHAPHVLHRGQIETSHLTVLEI
jgi:hypothetical protein